MIIQRKLHSSFLPIQFLINFIMQYGKTNHWFYNISYENKVEFFYHDS